MGFRIGADDAALVRYLHDPTGHRFNNAAVEVFTCSQRLLRLLACSNIPHNALQVSIRQDLRADFDWKERPILASEPPFAYHGKTGMQGSEIERLSL